MKLEIHPVALKQNVKMKIEFQYRGYTIKKKMVPMTAILNSNTEVIQSIKIKMVTITTILNFNTEVIKSKNKNGASM